MGKSSHRFFLIISKLDIIPMFTCFDCLMVFDRFCWFSLQNAGSHTHITVCIAYDSTAQLTGFDRAFILSITFLKRFSVPEMYWHY